MNRYWKGCFVLLAVSLVAAPLLAKKRPVIERYQATAMSLQAGRASRMEVGIFGWSTDEDRTAMIDAFKQGGDQAVYKLLGKQDEMAFVSLPGTLGYQMRYVYQSENDGKRIITMATDRPIAMGEIRRGSVSQDYNISLVILELDPTSGEGTGEMIVGADFGVNKKTGRFEIETAGRDPIKFTAVKPMKVKSKN
ncbi:MAG: hypothetical protein P8Y44_01475 [Acidobacteriota bacterium]